MSTDIIIGLVAIGFVALVIMIGNSRRSAREREVREAGEPLHLHDNDRSGRHSDSSDHRGYDHHGSFDGGGSSGGDGGGGGGAD
jgi:uncharacterized membrane protein YgcG